MVAKRFVVAGVALAGLAGSLTAVAVGAPTAAADGRVEVATSAELIAAFEDGTTDEIVMTAAITLTAGPDRPAGADPLDFDGGFFELTPAPGTWALGTTNATGDLTVRNALIRGAENSAIKWINGSVTVIDSSLTDNVGSGAGGAVFANGAPRVTVEGSNLDRNTASDVGGAIWSNGEIVLDDASFFGNEAGAGGAVSNQGGTGFVALDRTVLRQNEATDTDGGAIDAAGPVRLLESYLTGNVAVGDGGAISADGAIDVVRTGVAGNSAARGGALASTDAVHVVNSTLLSNDASLGGALLGGDVDVAYSTFVANEAPDGSSVASATGGTLTAFGVLLTDGVGATTCADFGAVDSQGWNIEGQLDTCGFDAEGDLVEVADAGLFGPNDYGFTIIDPPNPDSVVVDHIPAADCEDGLGLGITTDQFRDERPFGAGCDVGAIEDATPRAEPPGPTTPTTAPGPVDPGGSPGVPPAVPRPGSASYTG